jgi:uncharacterized RDD family membrane protein YckC
MVIEARMRQAVAPVPSALRRLTAWMIDYFIVAIYMGLLFFVIFLVTGGSLILPGVSTPGARQILGAGTLTLPVLLYFAIMEASARQGTIGKQATRLRVTDRQLHRIGFGRSLLRSAIKFTPWEVAHLSIHRIPKEGDTPPVVLAGLVGSLALAAIYLAGLFPGQGRPLYDVLAGTRVVEEPLAATTTAQTPV